MRKAMPVMENNKQGERVEFTREMRRTHTILIPNMAEIHFRLLRNVLVGHGYRAELLTTSGPHIAQEGLKYVHNDTCYPALLVIGQFIDALNSGKYDLEHTALLITQTGGGCRASNYIHLLRKALKKAGYGQIPVISLNVSGLEKNGGFSLTLPMIRKMIAAVVYGDLMMLLSNQCRPYEIHPGDTDRTVAKWVDAISAQQKKDKGYRLKEMRENLCAMAADFAALPLQKTEKVRVGVVGEIYVKYSPLGNNHLERFLASQDTEVMVPGIMGFLLFKTDNRLEDIRLYGGSQMKYTVVKALFDYLTKMETMSLEAVKRYPQFTPGASYAHLKTLVDGIIGYGSKMGEGWLLTAEMLELAEAGYANIVCTQPFGCLPNHIVGKGMIRRIKEKIPQANIVPIDYDPGATRVNQENRIKLMLSVAKEALPNQNRAEHGEKEE